MSIKRYLPALAWSAAAWLVLGGAIFGLCQELPEHPGWWCLIIPGGLIAAGLAWRAADAVGRLARTWRVVFWMMMTAAAGAYFLLLDWQSCDTYFAYSFYSRGNGRALAAVAAILPVLGCAWMWVRRRGTAQRTGAAKGKWWMDAAFGAGALAGLTCIAYVAIAKIYVPYECRLTEASWAAIGRPMPEFKQRLHPIQENASIRELTGDLAALGYKSLYRPRPGEGNPNTFRIPNFVLELIQNLPDGKQDAISSTILTSDDSAGKAAAFIDSHANDFNRLYQDVLRTEPPVWSFDPAGFPNQRMPNYMAAREISQLVLCDACLKLQRGDTQGADAAVSADLRLWSNISQQPILISSVWSHSMLDNMLRKALVRLPEDPDGLKNLAADVQAEHESTRTVLQASYPEWMTFADNPNADQWGGSNGNAGFSPIRPFREWITGLFGRALFKAQVAKDSRIEAEIVGITQRYPELVSSDLGRAEMERDEDRGSGSWMFPSINRLWVRENCYLLLREQIELIRTARTQMEEGKSGRLGDWASVVIPGSKWIMTGDAETDSVSLKLTPIPSWVAESTVVGDDFFLLPVNGSKSWKFGQPAGKSVAAR